jgi:hypothetical protein
MKTFKSFTNEAVLTYADAYIISKEKFIEFMNDIKGSFIYPLTPYMGGSPDRKPQWIIDNFDFNEASISLHPTGGNTTISDEPVNDMYFIAKRFFYKIENVSEKEYDDIYMKYVFPYDESNPSSPAIERDEEEIQ